MFQINMSPLNFPVPLIFCHLSEVKGKRIQKGREKREKEKVKERMGRWEVTW